MAIGKHKVKTISKETNVSHSIYIKDYYEKFIYFHNIVKNLDEVDIYFFSREIDKNSILALEEIIKNGNINSDKNTPYMRTKLYCCRTFEIEEFKNKLKEAHMKNVEIYNHHDKDFFHDRFILLKGKHHEDEIYLMGNGISAIKYQTAKMKAMCISKICGDNIRIKHEHQKHLIKDLDIIISESQRVEI